MDASRGLLHAVAAGVAPPSLRVFRPGPTAAFGRIDALRPGYSAARSAAVSLGYVPVAREAGGRAAIYDSGSLIVEVFEPRGVELTGVEDRFETVASLLADAIGSVGLAVELGELPGEYCPGRFSLHLVDGPKVAGVAQRIVRGATMVAAVLTVRGGPALRHAVAKVYSALEEPVDPSAAGALSDRDPSVEVEEVLAAVVEAASERWALKIG